MDVTVAVGREADGRWIAEVVELPGVITYGSTRVEAILHARTLAAQVIADRIEHDEWP